MKNSQLLKKAVAESLGTFALVFAGCGSIMIHQLYPAALPVVVVPVVFGLVVAAMVYATGHISGAHLNPAVTIAFAAVRRFPWREVPIYIVAQIIGAIVAVAILAATLTEVVHYGATSTSLTAGGTIIWEGLLTFLLMFVIVSVATDGRAVGIMAGAAIGATVMLNAFVGGPLTGASMNPARSLAPALFSGEYQQLWIYLVAPCIGAIAAAFCYEAIRCESDTKKTNAKGCC